MAFETYTARAQGFRAAADDCIAVGKSRIGLGTVQLPFEYVVIHFDRKAPAIMFTEGVNGDGFKVMKNGRTWYLAAKSFTSQNIIPIGVYERDTSELNRWIFRRRQTNDQL